MPAIYISRLVEKGTLISWNNFLPPSFPQSLFHSFQSWFLHPREPFHVDWKWTGLEDSMFPKLQFYLRPTLAEIERALKIYSSIERIGTWGSCKCYVSFATDSSEGRGFDHSVSVSRTRFRIDEPSLASFCVGKHTWDHSEAQSQADYWNQWVKRYSLPVEFFVSEGKLTRRIEGTVALHKRVERGTKLVQQVKTGFCCLEETPPLRNGMKRYSMFSLHTLAN
jgi:hypothetical protein